MTQRPDPHRPPSSAPEPLAIIGIGCRFPGADGPEAFWRLVRDGVDAITEVPADRFDIDTFYDPRRPTRGKLYTRWGGFLQGIDRFDPYFFGISPREAISMDPQHRLLLEVAWEALEDAGHPPDTLAGRSVGVFAGVINNDYEDLFTDPLTLDIYATAGNARSVLSGRVSYALGLEGPSVVVDTACSSSLVAVHLACQSLWSGESTLALAGGVNLILLPQVSMGFCQAQMLASDGRCKAFDASGDGFVRSDGAGVVVLKPLAAALADRDPIYAVIRGSAVNNDGRSGGLLMTPSQPGQEGALRAAYRHARVSPGAVDYVEAHGTGTHAGDPVEALALGAVLAEGRPPDRPCLLGSVKTNIGHAEAAAGVAGLIKVALCLKHRAIPPSLHYHRPNPLIPWAELPLVVPRELTPWPTRAGRRLAGVSSFGISGTNVHVVLEEAPTETERGPAAPEAQILTLSAHTGEALRALARAHRSLAERADAPTLADVCYTASVRRTHHDHRLALVSRSREELRERLDAFLGDEVRPGLASGRRIPGRRAKLVFVFPGQGSQWVGMARDLAAREPAFREALERCDHAMRAHLDWSVLAALGGVETPPRFDELDVIQPLLFSVQVALAALWRAWGIEPDAVVGHSMGEMAAAHVAGILSLDDAARVVCRRGQILARAAAGHGAMMVLELAADAARELVAHDADRLAVAACNGPTTTVISGEPAALERLRDEARRRGIFAAMVRIDYAPHSPLVDPALDEVRAALHGLRPGPGAISMISTVTAGRLDGRACDPSYWCRNLREPVQFTQALDHVIGDGHHLFLELSAHPVLTVAIAASLRHHGADGAALASLRREEDGRAVMLESLGALYALGYPVDWRRLHPDGGRCVTLPAYPWQRERFWLEQRATVGGSVRADMGWDRQHPLLGQRFRTAAQPGAGVWECELSVRRLPYLDDHRLQGIPVLPATAYVEAALAAAGEMFGPGPHLVEGMTFHQALFPPEDEARRAQVVLTPVAAGEATFQFFGQKPGGDGEETSWTLHATATIRSATTSPPTLPLTDPLSAIRSRCPDFIPGAAFYEAVLARGLQFGPSFQGVAEIWRRDGEALARLQRSGTVAAEARSYHLHPALLDACFQVEAAALPRSIRGDAEKAVFLPIGLAAFRMHGRAETAAWSHVRFRGQPSAVDGIVETDLSLLDEDGQVVAEVTGLRLMRLKTETVASARERLHETLYEIQWRPEPRAPAAGATGAARRAERGTWLICLDRRGVGQALRELLEARGERCVMVTAGEAYGAVGPGHFQAAPDSPDDFSRLIVDALPADAPPWRGVIHLWSLDAPTSDEPPDGWLESARRLGSLSLLHLVQALVAAGGPRAPRLWVVTGGVHAVGADAGALSVAQAPVWGLGGVVENEHPELRCTRVDLSAACSPEEIQALFHELWLDTPADQIALRGGDRHVARLVRWTPEDEEEIKREAGEDESFRLEVPRLGILESFTLRSTARRPPSPGEVEIRVHTIGLNFRDVLIAMGLVPPVLERGPEFGFECAGQVVAVGDGVDRLKPGDRVIATAAGCFGAFVTVAAALVAPFPDRLDFEEAATIPVAFLTAYYALHELARLRPGERVLIHAAAGGVGQAAVQIAQRAGAEIFATAGSPEKRDVLRAQGVRHVLDSRSLEFADEIMRLTAGGGVDVVLNSLAGEFIPRSLATLAPGGRFVEIGKVDVLRNSPLGLRHLEKNVAFFVVDLGQLFASRPSLCASMLAELMRLFEAGHLEPLTRRMFPIGEAADAFRFMAQARHIGKIVVTVPKAQVLVTPAHGQPTRCRADATYLVTGGLGGLGLAVAEWMVSEGARHLVLMGRSGAATAAVEATLDRLKQTGARVLVARADVADAAEVADVLDEMLRSMPPLRGVVHAAGVLDDGILLQLDRARFERVMRPKIEGAWNLHQLTRDAPLDFFVLFSSAASLLGAPGQGNYVAANAFLDALAHHRRALGLPALAIDWGAWGDVGMATRPERAAHLDRQGIRPIPRDQGLSILGLLLGRPATQVMAAGIDWPRMFAQRAPAPLLSTLADEGGRPGPASTRRRGDGLTRERLMAAEPASRPQLVEAFLREQLARVLKISATKLDVHQPLNRLGIDSLMAVEMKARVESDLEVTIPVALLLKGPTLAEMSAHLVEQLDAAAPLAPPMVRQPTPERLLARVDELSDAEVESLLGEDNGSRGPAQEDEVPEG